MSLPGLAALLLLLGCAPRAALREASPWMDPAAHRVGSVRVGEDVALEYLDFGGQGAPVVLLAGLGNTAHIFDDYAPRLTDTFHVVALTRRGFGASSRPAAGYDLRTRVEDLRQALEALHLDKVSLVGHSVAGDELTAFAGAYPERVHKLVYLEAAYDHPAIDAAVRDAPALPPPTPEDLASPRAFQAWQARLQGITIPESEVRASNVFVPSGQWTEDATPPFVYEQLSQGNAAPDYSRVHAPVLAYYVVEESADIVQPWVARLDAPAREQALGVLASLKVVGTEARSRLQRQLPAAGVVELRGTHHYFFLTHSEVTSEVRAFLLAP
ncbi:alpha/beta hydrolase [Corallococcus sp. M34]|uniref:alpha/beta fold hydrolase n=1 Tax=Citreicoccus inhibens TaxID=2849499 RepID=UPI001C232CB7|nr:alpha/beta fold hydrolase [Citreicoccus inhibens]MBU8897028.1 alpha/beta hydrolase [Citreicoccus inhibens]